MSRYGWMITRDAIGDPDHDDRGACGPGGLDDATERRLNAGEGERFRMFDDDGHLYYEGLLIGANASGFEPLDDFGTPNAGCTEIRYPNPKTGAWDTL